MTGRPTLALLIPAYNAAAFLPRLLESASEQSVPFDEIWVYDDCSSDDTGAVAERLGARVVCGTENVGCTEGKRRLLRHAKSDWVHFHDADDELLPCFVSRAHALIEGNDVDAIIVGSEERSDVDDAYVERSVPDPITFAQHPFATSIRYKVNAISGIYRRAFLTESDALNIDPAQSYNEDQAIQLRLVLAGARFMAVEEVLVRSYVQDASMSRSNGLKCLRSHLSVMKSALAHTPGREDRADIDAAIAERLWLIASGAPTYGDFETADEAARLASSVAPVPRSAGGRAFRLLAAVSPGLALRVREYAIRAVKPRLRAARR